MHNWFECKVKYEKNAEEGKFVNVNETYLVDAFSFTEAETRIIKEMEPFISGDFEVANIRRMRINEMFPCENGDKWYRSKINYITLDEEKGIEKRVGVSVLVQARDLKEACDALIEGMKNSLADYEIVSITETAIMDVYYYKTPEE